jgi:hypothetical protein
MAAPGYPSRHAQPHGAAIDHAASARALEYRSTGHRSPVVPCGWRPAAGLRSRQQHPDAGDVIFTPPDEWHWHAAAPDHFMTHLSITEAVPGDQPPETGWGEHVTDDEYHNR